MKIINASLIKWLSERRRKEEEFRNFRGYVLDLSIDIEHFLEFLIELMIMDKIEIKSLLRNEILTKLSFNDKIEIFRNIVSQNKVLKNENINELNKNLEKIRKIRNDFAHGSIEFKGTQPYLLNTKKGKEKWLKLDEKVISQFKYLHGKTMIEIEKLIRKFPKSAIQ